MFSTCWSSFLASDRTPGVLVSTGQLAKGPLRAPPKKVPPQLEKVEISAAVRMDQGPNWPLLQGPPQVTHTVVANGPLTDFWSVVCHPSLANSQTPRPPSHTHSGPLAAEIPGESRRRSVGRHRQNDDWLEGLQVFDGRVKPFTNQLVTSNKRWHRCQTDITGYHIWNHIISTRAL